MEPAQAQDIFHSLMAAHAASKTPHVMAIVHPVGAVAPVPPAMSAAAAIPAKVVAPSKSSPEGKKPFSKGK